MLDLDPIRDALNTTAGARFYRCALQVNPHHYSGSYRGKKVSGSEADFTASLLAEAEAAGIEVLALADHNNVQGAAAFAKEAAKKGIVVFPGFEATSKEGVHFLCLFEPGTKEAVLVRYLGGLGINEPGPNVELSALGCEDLADFVVSSGGLVIAAHVTTDNGLLTTLQGDARAKAWRAPDLHCSQIPGAISDLPMKYRQIVENKDPAHRRDPAPDGQAMAVVNAKDVVEPTDLADPAATCLIKMTEPSLEALRQAFLDPLSRVMLNSDPPPVDHIRLVAMAWEGGFLDGLRTRFSENLTTIIGGRGTGKSTIVESLRYVLELPPVGPEAEKNHEGIVADVLRPGTTVYLQLYSPHPSPKRYIIARTQPRPAEVFDESGNELKLAPSDLVPGLQILGQHEIGELTSDARLTGELLRRFVADTSAIDTRRDASKQSLKVSRDEIHRLEGQIDDAERRLLRLPAIKESLSRYKAAGYEEKTRKKTELDTEEQAIKSVIEQLDEIDGLVEEFKEDLDIEVEVIWDDDGNELPGADFLKRLAKALEDLEAAFEKGLEGLETAAEKARKKVDRVVVEWTKKRATPVNTEYDRLLKSLKAESVDADEYVRLQNKAKALGPIQKKLTQLRRKLTSEKKRRTRLVAEWEANGEALFAPHQKAARRVSRKLKGLVRLTLNPEGNREPFFKALRNAVGGRLQETIDAIAELDSFSISAFVESCRAGPEALASDYSLTDHQAGLVVSAGEALFLKLEELHLPHTAELELNVSGDPTKPDWRHTSRLSTGQRATAALLLLLLESEAPLIVDQPEDDLDNRFIADGIVPRLRNEKGLRQFVFCTHNANVPVLGDAELILGMDAEGDGKSGVARIPEAWRGSIDCPEIQDLVEGVLEGGKAAFETRRRKYGF